MNATSDSAGHGDTLSIKEVVQQLEAEMAAEQYRAFTDLLNGLQSGILGAEAFEQLCLEILPH